jgi:chemotaxis protein MotB
MNNLVKKVGTPHKISRHDPFHSLRNRSVSSLDIDSTWLITLSDVLSLMLVFFVMFIVIAKTSAKTEALKQIAIRQPPPAEAHPDPSSANKKILTDVSSEIKNLDLENEVSVRTVNKEIVITLKEKVTFLPGEAEVLKGSEPILDHIAEIIQKNPSFLIEIEGHTDNRPIKTSAFPSNWELSVARSSGVLRYFINRHDISPSRLSIKGSADQKPVASNDTPEDRAQNRRVEIRLKEKES